MAKPGSRIWPKVGGVAMGMDGNLPPWNPLILPATTTVTYRNCLERITIFEG